MGMSQSERVIYQALVNAAEAMRPCPKNDDLMGLIGASSDSTPPTIVRRLEEKGLIKVDRFQRSRRVYIVATDKWTPMPLNTAPHWRNRPQQVRSEEHTSELQSLMPISYAVFCLKK